ncbi:hypothetical protein B296_00022761 [Ensete ventricosum]|uniref:Zinc finger Sec23/Sec24-type domain-containing protein n=1 Tax=Ensete ventricosum TaxID=4639 RepID=A0A427AXP4_ENSVE|nr:hypothetical protein B296_00022761 [Ensete ventricosum]
MAVRATVSRFPVDADALESSGLPWGATVTPFAPADERGAVPLYGSGGHLLPRCDNCWAYLSTLCELERWGWSCALCGSFNGLDSATLDRYARPHDCPELSSSFIDLEIAGDLSVETCKDRIAAALETLKPTTSWERTTAAGQGLDGVLLGGRGFGVAMTALIDYLSSEYGNYGAGQLDTGRYGEQYASKREDADRALLPEQTPFYKDLVILHTEPPVLQVAFQYSIIVPREDTGISESNSSTRCLLRATINKLKEERNITPKLTFIRGGQDDATAFEKYLIEEQNIDASDLSSIMGFVSFLEEISRGVLEYLK